jgi:hypothetical protein
MSKPVSKPLPLCIDCRHHTAFGSGVHHCGGVRSLVTGEMAVRDCAPMREPGAPCGPNGKLFEQAEPVEQAEPTVDA